MSEIIEQLAEESGMTQYVAPNNKYLERFAKLIIDKCALQCHHNDDMDNILEYFGIE